ncbi:MAG: hypothetical protein K8T20_01460 [Planctomycetes bacterium]|nr:hypothetical protein [Planctomycetota bacterium]
MRISAIALLLTAAVASADPAPLREWTFDKGAEGWETILGTATTTSHEKDAGCLRWEYERGEKGKTAGVHVKGLKLASKDPVYFCFRIKAEGTRGIIFTARLESGAMVHQMLRPAKDGWVDDWISTGAMAADGVPIVSPADIREIMLWDEGDGTSTTQVVARLDRVRILAAPPAPAVVEMPAAVAPHPDLAVCLGFGALQDPKRIATELAEAKRLGFGMVEVSNGEWSDFETAPGKWDWSRIDPAMQAADKLGMKVVACLGGIVNIKYDYSVHVPAGVTFTGDFGALEPRYFAYLDHLFARYGKQIRFFTFHNENVGRYFTKHPEHLAPYVTFLGDAAKHIHKIAPGVRTGTCLQHSELPDVIKALCGVGDFTTFLFDPDTHPSWTEEEFAKLLAYAGDRKIALNETFQATSPMIGASEETQAVFVRELFAQMAKHRDRMEFATWWCVRDDDVEIWRGFEKILAPGNPGFGAALRELYTCGLLRGDGSAKPGAAEWAKGAAGLAK